MTERSDGDPDTVLGGRVILHQPADGYRVAIDPIFLAAAVDAQAGDNVLDVGCGVGAASLCLAARIGGLNIDGLEQHPTFAELAQRSVADNQMSDSVRVILGDLTKQPDSLAMGGYDHVMTNPPYLPANHGHPPPNALARAAERESTADLARWVKFCAEAATSGGKITFVHRQDRTQELCRLLVGAGCGDVTVYPLWPHQRGAGAKRSIVSAIKGAVSGHRVTEGMVLHQTNGTYTAAAQAVLMDSGSLAVG